MHKHIETIDRLFNSFISTDNPKDFFLGFMLYYDFAIKLKSVKEIFDEYNAKYLEEEEKYNSMNIDDIISRHDFEIEILLKNKADRKFKIWTESHFTTILFNALNYETLEDFKRMTALDDFTFKMINLWRKVKDGINYFEDIPDINIVTVRAVLTRVHNDIIVKLYNIQTYSNDIGTSISKVDFNKLYIKNNAVFYQNTQVTLPLGKDTQPLKFINTFIRERNSVLNLGLVFKEVFNKSKHSQENSIEKKKEVIKGNLKLSKNYTKDTTINFRVTYPGNNQISLELKKVKK